MPRNQCSGARYFVGRTALPPPTGFDHWKCPLAADLQKLPCHCEPVRARQSPAVLYAHNDSQKAHCSIPYVILSERSESKDLRTAVIFAVKSVRRSFDSGLCPPLRMTEGDDPQCCTPYKKQMTPRNHRFRGVFSTFILHYAFRILHFLTAPRRGISLPGYPPRRTAQPRRWRSAPSPGSGGGRADPGRHWCNR